MCFFLHRYRHYTVHILVIKDNTMDFISLKASKKCKIKAPKTKEFYLNYGNPAEKPADMPYCTLYAQSPSDWTSILVIPFTIRL